MKAHIVLLSHALAVLLLATFSARQANPNDLRSELDQSSISSLTSAQPAFQIIEADYVVIAVTSGDAIYINKMRVARGEVATEADRRLSLLPEERRIVYIKALPEVSYGTIVEIIEEIRARGYNRIGLVANKAQGQRGTALAPAGKTRASEGRERPRAQATGLEEDQLTVIVEAARRGGISVKVGETRIPLRRVAGTIRTHLRARANKSVMIVAPSSIKYGPIRDLADEVKKGGAEVVGLGIKKQ